MLLMDMNLEFLWLVLAIVFVVIELLTSSFGIIFLALGSFCTYFVAKFTDLGINWQLGTLFAVSLIAFVCIRPFALRFINKKNSGIKTNCDALIGRRVLVSETIDPKANTGQVLIDGEVWKATADVQIDKNEYVEIIKQDSLLLTVKKAD